jgi:hypothetical protein
MVLTTLSERKRYKMATVITKENTITKVKADKKTEVIEKITAFLAGEYGEDAVAMVRTGNTSKTNEIAVIVDTAEVEGETNPIVVTINPTVKEFANRKTDKKTYTAFDFAAAKAEYETYVAEKATKDAEKAKAKAEKIAKDEAKRKEKAEAED